MALRWYTVVVDSSDPQAQARWWAETLDWMLVWDTPEECVIIPKWAENKAIENLDEWLRAGQGMVFVPVPESKRVKNRLHVDLAPHTSQDRDAEIAALLQRGARLTNVGQGPDVTWTVLADPEGNEFCVLAARDR